ncbi:hypothetical protein [Salibacterium sp. K-3]
METISETQEFVLNHLTPGDDADNIDQLDADDFDSMESGAGYLKAYRESDIEIFVTFTDGVIDGLNLTRDYEVSDESTRETVRQNLGDALQSDFGYTVTANGDSYIIEDDQATGNVLRISSSAISGNYEYGIFIELTSK